MFRLSRTYGKFMVLGPCVYKMAENVFPFKRDGSVKWTNTDEEEESSGQTERQRQRWEMKRTGRSS